MTSNRWAEIGLLVVQTHDSKYFKIKVVDKDGNPVVSAKVSCNGNINPQDTTDSNGGYTCQIPAESRSVAVAAEAEGYRFFGVLLATQGLHVVKLDRNPCSHP